MGGFFGAVSRKSCKYDVFFGTDYPMWEPSEELDRFFRLPLTEEEQELILHKNAERLLQL